MKEKKMYKQFIRNKDRRPIGVLLAEMRDGKLVFGWSMHTGLRRQEITDPETGEVTLTDRAVFTHTWDKEYGTDVAKGRLDMCTRSFLNKGLPSQYYDIPKMGSGQADAFIKRVRGIEQRKIQEQQEEAVAQSTITLYTMEEALANG